MICYLDTSAIVKLYVDEEGSDVVRGVVADSLMVGTAKISYAETRAALARACREGALTEDQYRQTVLSFNAEWQTYLTLEISDLLLVMAGDLADEYRLCGFDAIHMASAALLQQKVKEPVLFGCWDGRLRSAALTHGFRVFPRD